MLDEQSLRRPEFSEGEPIVLYDGQTWYLPKPVLFSKPTRFAQKFEAGEDGVRKLGRPVALDGDPFFDKLSKLLESGNGAEFVLSAAFDLFLDLIGHNYRLTDGQAAELLPVVVDADNEQDEANVELWTSIINIAIGRSPKPSAATTES